MNPNLKKKLVALKNKIHNLRRMGFNKSARKFQVEAKRLIESLPESEHAWVTQTWFGSLANQTIEDVLKDLE